MVPALVLITIFALLLVDAVLIRRREMASRYARATPFDAATELFHHPGHAWVRPTPDGLVTVGATAFASHFAGELARIELPHEGRRLAVGKPAWTLVSRRGRRLPQVAPLSGKVLAVNERLRREPGLAQASPYEEGWLLRIRPRRLAVDLRGMLRGRAARAWRDTMRGVLGSAAGSPLGSVAQDGGEWVAGFGDRLDDESWERARRELFPLGEESVAGDAPHPQEPAR